MRRPSAYAPLGVHFATGRTGTAILERFGVEGLGVWASMIAAAKQHRPQGQLVFNHDKDWGVLGLAGYEPSFTLKSFLTFLGQRKQTRTTRQGRVTYVTLTRWGDWNEANNREAERGRKSRKRKEKEPDKIQTRSGHEADIPSREAEAEREKFKGSTSNGSKTTDETLPFEKQIAAAKLKALAPVSTEGMERIDMLCDELPQGSLEKVLESCAAKANREPLGAGYVINALRSERDELG